MIRGLFGALELVCQPDSRGLPHLSRQFSQPPFHVGKGYLTEDLLSIQVANPATGVFRGDTLSVQIAVENTNLRVSTPAATSLFPGKGIATIRQSIRVSGGWLEWIPEPLIPHAGARLDQCLELVVECAGAFYGVEILTPGRVARGEVLAYEEVKLRTSIVLDGMLLAKERLVFAPPGTNWMVQRLGFSAAYLATVWVVFSEPAAAGLLPAVESLQEGDLQIGGSFLAPRLCVFRVAAADSIVMRRGLSKLRERLGSVLPRLNQPLRRV